MEEKHLHAVLLVVVGAFIVKTFVLPETKEKLEVVKLMLQKIY